MKVALYYPWIHVKGGIERTIVELQKHSRHDFVIYTSHYDRQHTFPEFREMEVVELDTVSVKRSYAEVIEASLRIAGTKLKLPPGQPFIICCDGIGSLLSFRNSGNPLICLCFTPLRAVYDMEYRSRHLEKHRQIRLLALVLERLYRPIDKLAWKRFQHIFSISETVKQRLLAGRLAVADKIEIAHPGIDRSSIQASTCRDNFFFLPGRITWTKNIELAITSFGELRRRRGGDFRLVIAGMVLPKSREYFDHLQSMAREVGGVSFIPGPSDEEMGELYRRCYALLFTAFNEDYGLTPLEAMAKGKPVIAVNMGGPRELVVHGVTGLLVEPRPDHFSDAMEQLIDDPAGAEEMGRNGLSRAANFTWDRFVEKIDAYIDGLVPNASLFHGAAGNGSAK